MDKINCKKLPDNDGLGFIMIYSDSVVYKYNILADYTVDIT